MKKRFFLGMATVLLLSACSSNETEETEKVKEEPFQEQEVTKKEKEKEEERKKKERISDKDIDFFEEEPKVQKKEKLVSKKLDSSEKPVEITPDTYKMLVEQNRKPNDPEQEIEVEGIGYVHSFYPDFGKILIQTKEKMEGYDVKGILMPINDEVGVPAPLTKVKYKGTFEKVNVEELGIPSLYVINIDGTYEVEE